MNDNINYLFSINDCPVVITSIEHPFRILYVNKTWEYLCGYSLKEIVGKSIYILRHKKINDNVAINKKKNNKLFIHFFEIFDIPEYNIAVAKTKFYKDL